MPRRDGNSITAATASNRGCTSADWPLRTRRSFWLITIRTSTVLASRRRSRAKRLVGRGNESLWGIGCESLAPSFSHCRTGRGCYTCSSEFESEPADWDDGYSAEAAWQARGSHGSKEVGTRRHSSHAWQVGRRQHASPSKCPA